MELQDARILVTGATGSVGQQLVYELAKRDIKPVAHVRETSNLAFIDSLGLEKRVADLRDRAQMVRLVEGMDAVIHAAGWVDFRRDRLTQFAGINTFGALEMYQAATDAGVKRFVHVSSVAAVGATVRRGDPKALLPKHHIGEDHEFNLDHLNIPYIQTKRAAELELLKLAAESDTELVIVNPSIIAAPDRNGDKRVRFRRYFRRPLMFQFPNWINLVDLRDVALGVVAALESGRPNERYILAGDNITVFEAVLVISAILGCSPFLITPPRLLLNLTARWSLWWKRITGRGNIRYYPHLVKLLDYDWAFSSMKARRELGYSPRPIYTTLSDLLTDNFQDSYVKPTGLAMDRSRGSSLS